MTDGNYDGQGKSREREINDSLRMLGVAFALLGVVAGALLIWLWWPQSSRAAKPCAVYVASSVTAYRAADGSIVTNPAHLTKGCTR